MIIADVTEKQVLYKGSKREELFAYAYIKYMGNATAAAREAFNIKSDSYAAKKGSEMVRKSKVQELINEAWMIQREQHEKFLQQGPYYLFAVAEKLLKIVQDDKTSVDDCIKAAESLTRLAGVELSEAVTIARIRAEAAIAVSKPEGLESASNGKNNLFSGVNSRQPGLAGLRRISIPSAFALSNMETADQ